MSLGKKLITRIIQLVALTLLFIAVLLVDKQIKTGKIPSIRSLPAIDALEEAVGRAAEMGRPVFATTGYGRGTLQHVMGVQHLAGMAVIAHLARLTARMDAELIVAICPPEAISIVDASIREAYIAEGKEDAYSPDMIRFFSTLQWGYTIGVLGVLQKERPASSLLIGAFLAESLVIAESGARIGAFQIAGTAVQSQLSFFIATCNYVLIGEEIFAANAYMTKDPHLISSIRVADIGKIVITGLLILSVIFSTVGSNWLVNFLSL